MGLVREPKDVDFTVKSEPWTEEELVEFRKIMDSIKKKKKLPRLTLKNPKRKEIIT